MTAPNFHVINAIAPIANWAGTTFDTDVVDAGVGDGVLFLVIQGVNAGGVSTVTVEASDDTDANNVTTVPFVYRTCVATDVWGAWTEATTAGFSSSAILNSMHQIYVDGSELAEAGYRYVRLSGDETAANAVIGCVAAIIVNPRFGPTTLTALD